MADVTYEINIEIPDDAVAHINNDLGQFVTLVKSVQSSNRQTHPVAWITMEAMDKLTVSWTEDYYIYASKDTISPGVRIHGQSLIEASLGEGYAFKSGNFTDNGAGSPGSFEASNGGGDTYVMGLAQTSNLSPDPVPINAITVGDNEDATFTPEVKVSVFLQGYNDNGIVISEVSSHACLVQLTTQEPSATLTFNKKTNTFAAK